MFRLTAFGDGDSLLARWGKVGDARGACDWGSAEVLLGMLRNFVQMLLGRDEVRVWGELDIWLKAPCITGYGGV